MLNFCNNRLGYLFIAHHRFGLFKAWVLNDFCHESPHELSYILKVFAKFKSFWLNVSNFQFLSITFSVKIFIIKIKIKIVKIHTLYI
jgi:hypothetical protein